MNGEYLYFQVLIPIKREIKNTSTCFYFIFMFLVLEIEPRNCTELNTQSFFIFRQGLTKLARLGTSLESSCLSLLEGWHYRCEPTCGFHLFCWCDTWKFKITCMACTCAFPFISAGMCCFRSCAPLKEGDLKDRHMGSWMVRETTPQEVESFGLTLWNAMGVEPGLS